MKQAIPQFCTRLSEALVTEAPATLQVNVGKLCNQACKHCHVDAGPKRREIMTEETVRQVLDAVDYLGVETVDLTGGAPEMNPHFRMFVRELRQRDVHVIDRCNLTILSVKGYAWVADFLAQHEVEVVASLPYYLEDNVDRQRGKGVFDASIQGLHMLNERGYGSDGRLKLNLVFNPQGAYLPPAQEELEEQYKRHLKQDFGLVFDQLFTITNMPIARFKRFLEVSGNYDRYMRKLAGQFNPGTLSGLMCRHLISVGWDGYLYDCDFNQMLELPLGGSGRPHISAIREVQTRGREIAVGNHCYGCTAGSGSSCGGTLKKDEAVSV